MNTEQMQLSNNIQGALTGYGLDLLEAFMREPAELASIVPVAPIIPAPAAYLAALEAAQDAYDKAPVRRLPETEQEADEWDF